MNISFKVKNPFLGKKSAMSSMLCNWITIRQPQLKKGHNSCIHGPISEPNIPADHREQSSADEDFTMVCRIPMLSYPFVSPVTPQQS